MTRRFCNFAFLVSLLLGHGLLAKVIYVDDNTSAGGDGSSWSNPYQDLQDAFDVALSGDEIWIAEGVYYKEGGFVLSDIADSQRFHVFGSFRNGETSKVNRDFSAVRTVISGDLLQNDSEEWSSTEREENDKLLTVENSYTIHFDGIDFENGIGEYQGFAGERKAAITLKDTSIVFNKCLFLRNGYSTGDPMGVASAENCSVNFINCIFVENTGGIFHGRSVTTPSGNGSLSVNFTNNVFYGNYRSRLGSLVWITSVSSTSSATSLLHYSTIVGDHKFYSSLYASTTGAGNIFYSTGTLYNSDPTDQGIDSETLPSIYSDYEFFNISSPNGSDGKWGTEDDGLRLEYSDSLRISGEKFYDNHDIDQDGIFSESAPFNLYGASASLTPILMYGAYDLASVPVNFTIISPKSGGGSVSGTGTFTEGKEIQIQATAEEGYAFWKWEIITITSAEPPIESESYEATLEITVSSDLYLNPVFVKTDLLSLADHDLSSGWFKSDWFGIFWGFSDEWIYHSALGWLYVHPKDGSSYWMWSSEYGWLWVHKEHFPYLYQNSSSNPKYINGSWLFLNEENDKILRFDKSRSKWINANPTVQLNISFAGELIFEDPIVEETEGLVSLSTQVSVFGSEFSGWYIGDELVSSELNASIELDSDSEISGVFVWKEMAIISLDIPEMKLSFAKNLFAKNLFASSILEQSGDITLSVNSDKNTSHWYNNFWTQDILAANADSNASYNLRYPVGESLELNFPNNYGFKKWLVFDDLNGNLISQESENPQIQVLVSGDMRIEANATGIFVDPSSIAVFVGPWDHGPHIPDYSNDPLLNLYLAFVPVSANLADELDLKLMQPGTFHMGSPPNEPNRGGDEELHEVEITDHFLIGQYEVTNSQWKSIKDANHPLDDEFPVTNISWSEAKDFCEILTTREREAGRIGSNGAFDLPTEAEWEYACRAGSITAYSWGDDFNASRANYAGSGIGSPVEVGSYLPNSWGLYDMHGNVWELTADIYAEFTSTPQTDPTGAESGDGKVMKGGSYSFNDHFLRSARRGQTSSNGKSPEVGFRICYRK